MVLLQATNLHKHFGAQDLFTIDRLEILRGERLGIVGANGSGKTTLLRILAGDLAPDGGAVRRNCELAFIRQLEDAQDDAQGLAFAQPIAPDADSACQSGGERTRLKIAQALAQNAPLLLADEPTANLDAQGAGMLESMLRRVETLVIISHDRALLDALCTGILELRDGDLHRYPGNYGAYAAQRAHERRRALDEFEAYTQERDRLTAVARKTKEAAKKASKKPGKGISSSEARMRAYMMLRKPDTKEKNIAKRGKAVEKRIEQLEVKERPRELPTLRMDFQLTDPPRGRFIAETEGLAFAYDGRPVLHDIAFQIPTGAHVALTGPNGAGKTTLLRLLHEGHPAIRIAPKARFGYFRQQLDGIDPERTALENVLRGSVQSEGVARSLLARLLLRGEDVFKPAGVLSGGERVKLSLAMLLAQPCNVLLLDEPTNYLDIPSIEAVQQLLADYEGTMIFTAHDRTFSQTVATATLQLLDGRAKWHGRGYLA